MSIYIVYQYVAHSSTQINTKGGTFVEGIFGSTSYLPYLRNDIQSTFYQWLLFNACLKPSYISETVNYVPDLCEVQTKDNKTYTVSLDKWFIWSDGTPVSIEDVFFTYNELLVNNMWKLPALTQYNTITIEKDANNTLKIIFPTTSSDNILFFTHYILPKHILINAELIDYRNIFAFNPTYTNCGNLVSQTKDEYSLVFNLVNCPQSNLNYYQIKNLLSFEAFKNDFETAGKSIVDAYIGNETFKGYTEHKLLTNKLITVFFNTRSDKLRVRGRRVLWWLIKHNFYSPWYESYFKKNDDGLFDVFQSTGAWVKDLINREYSENIITKDDLIDANVTILPSSLSIKWENQKLAHFVDSWTTFPTEFVFDKGYDTITIEYKAKSYSLKHFSKWGKTWRFTFDNKAWTLWSWLNKYEIYGSEKTKKILLWTLDIYNMISEEEEQEEYIWTTVKLTIIYYSNDINTFVIDRLKTIFTEADISENFIFEEIHTPEQLQGKLLVGDYDILINTVDMWLRKDLTKLFSTDKSEVNPSQYQNQRLTTLLGQYISANEKDKKKHLPEINSIYSKDMPFVILWNEYLNLNIRSSLMDKLFYEDNEYILNEYNRRDFVYRKLQLVSNIHIDGKQVWNFENFWNFLTDAIK